MSRPWSTLNANAFSVLAPQVRRTVTQAGRLRVRTLLVGREGGRDRPSLDR